MTRAGREPAEDIKRRLVLLCRDAGLKVSTARMYLRREQGDRLILIGATRENVRKERWIVSIITAVSVNGDWDGEVDIRCSISPEDLLVQTSSCLVMRGRNRILYDDLKRQLRDTLNEREQVMAALNVGIEGPYTFSRTRWEDPLDWIDQGEPIGCDEQSGFPGPIPCDDRTSCDDISDHAEQPGLPDHIEPTEHDEQC